jgi:mannose-6-phosphate isomerase-like protein (cupin superfamily)
MSNPDPHYLGTDGQVSARFRPAGTPPELPRPGGAASYLATGAATRKFGLYRWDLGPDPAGAGAHFHRTFSESFSVLSGTVQLYDGTRWFDGRPDDFVPVPEGDEQHDNIYV